MKGSAPDQFNQAIMEFGALHCTPRQPHCNSCPFNAWCHASINGSQQLYPVKQKKTAARNRYFYYYVIRSGPGILLKKREHRDIWQGLYDFLLVEYDDEADPLDLLAGQLPDKTWMNEVQVGAPSEIYRHKLTHQQINACFVLVETDDQHILQRWKKTFALKEFNVSEVHQLPKPILIDNYLKADIF
jgi:A/G-specific adenine glycosylase